VNKSQSVLRGGLLGLVLAASAAAGTIPASVCDLGGPTCYVYEDGNVLSLGFLSVAGDVILRDAFSGAVSDVFRIFNDFFDTGGGTGLGTTAFLFSDDEHNLPTTYSSNAVTITESTVVTDPVNHLTDTEYFSASDGVMFEIYSRVDAPEPSSVVLFTVGIFAIGLLALGFRAGKPARVSLPVPPSDLKAGQA
jgi:hypothetical protein